MKKKRVSARIAIVAILTIVLLFTYTIVLTCMTHVTAHNYYQILRKEAGNFQQELLSASNINTLNAEDSSNKSAAELSQNETGFIEYQMLKLLKTASEKTYENYSRPKDYISLTNPNPYDLKTAAVFFDSNGNLLLDSSNYLFFSYYLEEDTKWNQDQSKAGYSYIDLDNMPQEVKEYFYQAYDLLEEREELDDVKIQKMKISGRMKEAEIFPTKIEVLTNIDFSEHNSNNSSLHKRTILSEAMWQNIYEDDTSVSESEFVTIYASNIEIIVPGNNEEVLSELIKKGVLASTNEKALYTDQFIFYDNDSVTILDHTYQITTAFFVNAMDAAKHELKYVYSWTTILFVLVWIILNKIIYKKLIQPIRAVNNAYDNDFSYIWKEKEAKNDWQETYELITHYLDTRTKNFKTKTEMERLKTALEYSAQAEENRRQMVSNIAHELKTPLAIIQSYSEGLKENIAEQKKDEYYDVILSEIQRMDEMVMEMLDLSRLEAGKTKLSNDEFSMEQMTQAIFEKFMKLIKEKNLRVSLECSGECRICADESRIYQVISNMISNAVSYTPNHGFIIVKLCQKDGNTTFRIENTCKPFSKEELEKVWDAFYRADKSRNTTGTGLGLAICKNIIELHGGTCSVENTRDGVEFSFKLKDRAV